MPRLGHAARLRAHMRQIGECVTRTLELANEGGSLERLVSRLNQEGNAWHYEAGYASDISPDPQILYYTSTEALITTHEEIARILSKWEESETPDGDFERAAGQVKELAMMAWALEREKRGQAPGTRYLTLDVDPITLRLLAFIHEAREGREDEGRNVILDDAVLAGALRGNDADNLKKARRTLQRIVTEHGDGPLLREEYQINGSDIPDLRSIAITIENGSARSVVSFFGASQIDYITDGTVKLRFEMTKTQAAGYTDKPLRQAIQHPMTDGLGLMIERVETYSTSQGNVSGIRTDACGRARLTAMVMNMENSG